MLINFANQYFKSVGSIIDFKLKPTFEVGDFTKRISIMAIYPNGKRRQMDEYKVFDKDINFSLLFKDVGEYELRVQVECISGRVLNTIIKFEIFDISDVDITIYKVINNRTPDFNLLYSPHKINKFTFSRRIDDDKNMLFKQYIPTKVVDPRKLDGHNWRGVCLNHMYILEDKDDVGENNYINNHYHKISREIGDKKYIICISKRFGFVPKEPWVKSFRDKIYNRIDNIRFVFS
jgi:hypothetical protein